MMAVEKKRADIEFGLFGERVLSAVCSFLSLFTFPAMSLSVLSRAFSRCRLETTRMTATRTVPVRQLSAAAQSRLDQRRKRAAQARQVKKKNLKRQAELRAEEAAKAPSVVLGHPKSDDAIWRQSLLARTLLDKRAVWKGEQGEGLLNFGVPVEAKELLFEKLPVVSAERALLADGGAEGGGGGGGGGSIVSFEPRKIEEAQKASEVEKAKADQLSRIVDLRNANSDGIAAENRRRIVELFGRTENDTASPEVVGEHGEFSLC
jgi:small subunit ribosomal protein S15